MGTRLSHLLAEASSILDKKIGMIIGYLTYHGYAYGLAECILDLRMIVYEVGTYSLEKRLF